MGRIQSSRIFESVFISFLKSYGKISNMREAHTNRAYMPVQDLSRRDFLRKIGVSGAAVVTGVELFNPRKVLSTECEYRDMREIFELQDHKMTFEKYYIFVPPVSKGKEPGLEKVILLDGGIELGSADEFRKFVQSNNFDAGTTVYLNSTGGVVDDALDIGRVIREKRFNTAIGTDPFKSKYISIDRNSPPTEGVCLSACTFTFLGGIERRMHPGDLYGVHRFHTKIESGMDRAQIQTGELLQYVREMGAKQQLIEYMAQVGPDKFNKLQPSQLRSLDVITTTNFLPGEKATWIKCE